MKNKKGVSEIVSTVLIIMIAIAAIGIIAAIVVPMIRDSLASGQGCYKALSDISLDREVTCVNYSTNASTNNSTILLGVSKGPEVSIELAEIQVLLYRADGSSVSRRQNTSGLNLNEVRMYNVSFNQSIENYTSVNIVPVLKIGNKIKVCEAPKERIPLGNCR